MNIGLTIIKNVAHTKRSKFIKVETSEHKQSDGGDVTSENGENVNTKDTGKRESI